MIAGGRKATENMPAFQMLTMLEGEVSSRLSRTTTLAPFVVKCPWGFASVTSRFEFRPEAGERLRGALRTDTHIMDMSVVAMALG